MRTDTTTKGVAVPSEPESSASANIADRYLAQMIRTLARFDGVDDFVPAGPRPPASPLKRLVTRTLISFLRSRGLEVMRRIPFDATARSLGRDWPIHADTMIGIKRLENIRDLVKAIIAERVPGDLVETGVWRGGGSIMMRAALETYGDADRTVWCANLFEGLPPPDLQRYPQDAGTTWHTEPVLAVSLETVKENFAKYGLLDERVRFLKGWFKDTLPTAPIETIAILRLDGDHYSSTMDALNALYKKVSPGGFVIVDDYKIPEDTCRRAVDDFRAAHGVTDPLVDVDGFAAYWRTSRRRGTEVI